MLLCMPAKAKCLPVALALAQALQDLTISRPWLYAPYDALGRPVR